MRRMIIAIFALVFAISSTAAQAQQECKAPKAVVAEMKKAAKKNFVEARIMSKAEVAKLVAAAKAAGNEGDAPDTIVVIFINSAQGEVAFVFVGTGGKVCQVQMAPGAAVRKHFEQALVGTRV